MDSPQIAPAPQDESALQGQFADRVRAAIFWRWGSQALGQLITWTVTILIVRLLDPHDYGLFAMAQAVMVALNFLNGYSFATSLIQAKEVDERRIGQVFGLLIVSNVLLATTQWLAAPQAAIYYGQPQVADMLRVQALLYLTTPFFALPSALLARQLEFRSQALINLVSSLVSAVVGLLLAWFGYGVWALVWAPIALFATRGLGLTLANGGLAKPVFDFRGAGDVVSFGTALTLCQLFWIVQSQSDIVIAGRLFNPHDLGLYSESLFLTLIFTGRFLPPLNDVAFPAYSELAKAGKPLASAFLKSARLIMLVAAPFYVGLSMTAGPLVTTFFGAKWLEMIPIVSGLAIVMPAMALQIACSPTTNALGIPKIYLLTSISGAVIMPIFFFTFAGKGPMGLVHAWQMAAPLLLAATLLVTLPAIGAKLADLVRALLPVALSCAGMALVVHLVDTVVAGQIAPLRLGILTGAGAIAYLGILWLVWPDVLRSAWAMLRREKAPTASEAEAR
jgi:O-antigen/teichoic acid export membrane protein